MRVEDGELVAFVLEEPDLGVDLEPEAVRRGLGVPATLVAQRLAAAQDDDAARLVRRLLVRVPLQLGANSGPNPQWVPPQNST